MSAERETKVPEITVGFDFTEHTVRLAFDQAEFKTWDMVVAALDMAKSFAEFQRNVARTRSLQQAAMQQAVTEQQGLQLAAGIRQRERELR